MWERNINWLGLNPQPRHVPRPGIEPETFCFTETTPNQLSHTSRGLLLSVFTPILIYMYFRGLALQRFGSVQAPVSPPNDHAAGVISNQEWAQSGSQKPFQVPNL